MHKVDVIRAWKDEDYRESLSAAERAALPEHPAGVVELSANDLALVSGGDISENDGPMCGTTIVCTAWGTCGGGGQTGPSGICY